MNSKQPITRLFGVVLACATVTYAAPALAGKPVKPPPPEPPPPAGPAYRIYEVGRNAAAPGINNAGVVAGYDFDKAFTLTPEPSLDGPVYFRDSDGDGINDLLCPLPALQPSYNSWAMSINDAGVVAGVHIMVETEPAWDTATVWAGGAPPVNLGIPILEDFLSTPVINNPGMVLVGRDFSTLRPLPCYLVVPADLDVDGVPDTWFLDANGDGANDLLYVVARPPSASDFFRPTGINDAGQIILHSWTQAGFFLAPDYQDADGDGNPWYADADGDGNNDLLVRLNDLNGLPGDTCCTDINSAGQVVGHSNDRAVVWNFAADGTQTITDLGLLNSKTVRMSATAINDQGDILGEAVLSRGRTVFLVKNGVMYDLKSLLVNGEGWENLRPDNINNDGVITGHISQVLNMRTYEVITEARGFVAVPVPQP